MAGYVPLPAARMPENAMLNFKPLNDGINAFGDAIEYRENAMLRRKADARAASAESRAATNFSQQQEDRRSAKFNERVKLMAGFVNDHVLTEKDPTLRAQKWNDVLSSHADFANAPDLYRDPVKGPELFISQAQGYISPLDKRKSDLENRKTEAEINKLNREAAGSNDVGLQVMYGRDADGNLVPMQASKNGKLVRSQMPEGVTPDLEAKSFGSASGKERGEATGKAQSDLRRVTDNAGLALKTIEGIKTHPGKRRGLGWTAFSGYVPSSDERGFANLVDQAKGQTFLEAFNSLRGGGQITEAEGAKATQALARLDRWQSQEDFDTALADLETVIRAGVARAQGNAGVEKSTPDDGWRDFGDGIRIREKR